MITSDVWELNCHPPTMPGMWWAFTESDFLSFPYS